MLSIRFDSNESTRIVSLGVDSLCRKSIWKGLRKYSFPGLYRVGWKCFRIDTNRFPCCRFVMPEVDLRRSPWSWFARVFEITASRVYTGWVENVVDSNESTRIVSLAVDLLHRKSICEIFRKYSFPGLYRVGWKCCRFDSIRSNRHESLPLLSIRYAGSRFARVLENIGLYRVSGLYRVGWKCCRFDSIRTNRHESFPLLSIRYTGSRFARYLER